MRLKHVAWGIPVALALLLAGPELLWGQKKGANNPPAAAPQQHQAAPPPQRQAAPMNRTASPAMGAPSGGQAHGSYGNASPAAHGSNAATMNRGSSSSSSPYNMNRNANSPYNTNRSATAHSGMGANSTTSTGMGRANSNAAGRHAGMASIGNPAGSNMSKGGAGNFGRKNAAAGHAMGANNNAGAGKRNASLSGSPHNPALAGHSTGAANAHNFREVHVGRNLVRVDNSGRYRQITSARGVTVYHGVNGRRMIVAERGGRRVVAMGAHRGYLERPYRTIGGHQYRLRTYYVGGYRYATVYRTYYWGGRPYYWYTPAYYYRPAYYRWVYNPWPGPVYYRWGWYAAPWYRHYGYYYTPYAYYPSANFWLTDYLLAENLRMSYEAAGLAALPSPDDGRFMLAGAGASAISPEVRQLLANEVKQQLAAEKAVAEAPGSAPDNQVPAALDPAHRVFLVSSNLDVTTDSGQECGLTPGDILERTSTNSPDGENLPVRVRSSKKDDCPVGSNASVAISDLNEMHNRLREQIDVGLKHLADNHGMNGLPSAPDTGTTAAPGVPAPQADADVDSQINSVESEADQAEREVKQNGSGGGK